MVLEVIGNKHRHATGPEQLCSREKIAAVHVLASRQKVAHRELHQRQDLFVGASGVLFELRQGAVEHVEIDMCGRAKTPPLDQDCFVMQSVRWLKHLAIRAKHGRATQAQLDEFQCHDAIVHVAKFDPAQFQQIDLDAAGGQLVE